MIQVMASLYNFLGIQSTPNMGEFWGLIIVLFIIIVSFMMLITANKRSGVIKSEQRLVEKNKEIEKNEQVKISFKERLKRGLSQSRLEIWGKVGSLFSRGLDEDTLDEIEELLYGADIGPQMIRELIESVESANRAEKMDDEGFKKFMFNFFKSKMERGQGKLNTSLYEFDPNAPKSLKTIMIVGVNGAGKTTTIGKLATKLKSMGANVVVGACDTFRAAAVDQLQVWCDRAGVEMIRAKEGTNPTGVAYDTLQSAINSGADYCILDTAGRLHTKENLMDELARTKRVLQKLDQTAPQETLLVIDAITGQNALLQAENFNNYLGLTGLIFTKCDGSSKAGSAISISHKLGIPINYIGVGEKVEDLDRFDLNDYLEALLYQ